MTDLPSAPRVNVTPRVHPEDVRGTLRGLDPGWYRARDLEPRYRAVAQRAGREPGTVKSLGETIRREFPDVALRHVHGHMRAYQITDEMTKVSR